MYSILKIRLEKILPILQIWIIITHDVSMSLTKYEECVHRTACIIIARCVSIVIVGSCGYWCVFFTFNHDLLLLHSLFGRLLFRNIMCTLYNSLSLRYLFNLISLRLCLFLNIYCKNSFI